MVVGAPIYDLRVSDPSSLSRRYVARLVASLSLITLTCVAFLLPVPYVTFRPGPVFDTLGEFEGKPMFTFGEGVKTYPTTGNLDFTTVSVTSASGKMSLFRAVQAYFTDDTSVVPRSIVYPEGTTADSSKAESAAQLDSSKEASEVAALRAAGYTVPGLPQVASLTEGGAAEGVLEVGDLITSVDGTAVDSSAEAVELVGQHAPGDEVDLTIRRGDDTQDVKLTTKPDPQDASVPRIGVGLGTKYDYPIQVDNNVGSTIGGPSAGTMFALAIYDKLTPGGLAGDLNIAGTGEITAEGVVGPIGGVQQKIAGAWRAGAQVFLVPAANCAEAVDGDTHGLKLVEVKTLDGAIDAVGKLAKDRTAEVPTCR